MAKWEAQFNQMMNSQREDLDFDYGGMMQSAWEGGMGDSDYSIEPAMQFDEEGLPVLGDYVFGTSNADYRMSVIADHANIEQDNKFLDPSHSKSSLQDAKDLLARNGSLSEAALLLEAAIQHGDLGEGGYEAWILLGETRAMDERDEAAMRALLEGVKRAEAAGAAGAGMLVSGQNPTQRWSAYASMIVSCNCLHKRVYGEGIPHDAPSVAECAHSRCQHPRGGVEVAPELVLALTRASHRGVPEGRPRAVQPRPDRP